MESGKLKVESGELKILDVEALPIPRLPDCVIQAGPKHGWILDMEALPTPGLPDFVIQAGPKRGWILDTG